MFLRLLGTLACLAMTASPAFAFTLTMQVTGAGSTTPAVGSHEFSAGQFVSLAAIPEAGWAFDHWEGDAIGTNADAAIVMDSDKMVTAVFVEGGVALTLLTQGAGTTSPAAGTHLYVAGRTVSLSAFPSAGVTVFDHWEGDLTGTARDQQLLMDEDKTVTAVFVPLENFTLTIAVSGNGTTSPASGAHVYASASSVPILPLGDPGWAFDHWEGDLSGTDQFGQSITMNSDKTVTAVFLPQDYTITVALTGNGQTIPPPGVYGALADREFQVRASTAPPVPLNVAFDHWEGDFTGTANPATLTVDGDKAVTAVFTEVSDEVTLTLETSTGGAVSPAGITSHTKDAAVIISATPDEGWVFVEWQGNWTGTTNPDTVPMNFSRTITALFAPIIADRVLTTAISGEGQISPTAGTQSYPQGTEVAIEATPAAGWRFDRWDGDLSGSANPASITMDGDRTVTAVFERLDYVLTITISGAGETDPAAGEHPYISASEANVTATPAAGWMFNRWEGDITGAENPVDFVMDNDTAVTAVFTQLSYTLTMAVVGGGTVTPPAGAQDFLSGSPLEISATPLEGWTFDHWEGNLTGNENPTNLLLNADLSITAVFIESGEGEGEVPPRHDADQDGDGVVGLSELLRVIQFYNSEGYHCQGDTEDGFAPGTGDATCTPHSSDYASQDWDIALSELLRLIQFYNTGAYHPCESGEDGYCPGQAVPAKSSIRNAY